MKFTWLENNSFLIESSYPKKILINPSLKFLNKLDSSSNLLILYPSDTFSEIPSILSKKSIVLNSSKSFSDDDLVINSYTSFMDNVNGLRRGETYIYSITMNNINIVHLGFLGCIPDSSILQSISNPDILLIPIGGNICLDAQNANKLITLLNPKFIIPMNYKYSQDLFYYDGLHKFITTQKEVIKLSSSTLYYQDIKQYPIQSTLILTPKCQKI